MKRAKLIATGTVGGLGAVLAITPPTFTSTQYMTMALLGAATVDPVASAPTNRAPSSQSTTPAATLAATKKATPNKAQSQTQAPVAFEPTQAALVTKSVSGTFTGDSVNVCYRNVQVKITVENGKITDAQAVDAPLGRNGRWTQMSVPVLRECTLQGQLAAIGGVSGASFTSYGWYTSLVSTLAKAGM